MNFRLLLLLAASLLAGCATHGTVPTGDTPTSTGSNVQIFGTIDTGVSHYSNSSSR
jgi:hypothetical protein